MLDSPFYYFLVCFLRSFFICYLFIACFLWLFFIVIFHHFCLFLLTLYNLLKGYTQQTFHCCFNDVLRLIRHREVGQRQINVKTTLLRQHWNYDVEKRRIIVVYFNVDLNNVGQRWNNETALLFCKVNFLNVG